MNRIADLVPRLAPPPFEHVCQVCAAQVSRPGLCLDCDERRRTHAEALRTTRQSIPARFAWARDLEVPELDARVDGVALASVRRLAVEGIDRVTLLGPAGSGKTSIAVALATAFVTRAGKAALFASATEIGVARQQHGLGAGEAALVRQATSAPLLVLDDLGQEIDAGAPVVAHVIQRRYDDARPTIATSGLSVDQLAARYGAGVTRRLVEAVGGAVLLKTRAPTQRGTP